MYLAKLMNLLIYLTLNIEMVTSQSWFSEDSVSIIGFNENNQKFDCRED